MNAVIRRTTAVALSALLATQNAGCGSAPAKTELQTACGEGATEVRSESKDTTGAGHATFEYRTGDQTHCALVAPSRRYTVTATVEWSNGWSNRYEMTTDLNAEPDQRYLVRAYEKDKGETPVKEVTLGGYVTTPAKIVILGLAIPMVAAVFVMSAPFVIPAALIDRHRTPPDPQPKPTDEPSKGCCFTWIERGSTGEVVAGERPDSSPTQPVHAQRGMP